MKLSRLKELAEAATPSPWSFDEDEQEIYSDVWAEGSGDPYHIVSGDGSIDEKDAKFIAAMNPETALKLISALEEAKEVIRIDCSDAGLEWLDKYKELFE